MSDLKLKEEKFVLENENFEMLKSMYDFQAVYPKTISFDEGEYFILHQTSARQRNWWQVVSMKGNIGFVPSNYVTKLKVEPEFLLGFLESSIESLKMSTEKDINSIISREQLIEHLLEKKANVEKILAGDYDPKSQDSDMTSSAKEERPHKVGNGAVKNVESDHDEDHEDRSEAKMKPQKHMTAKKSMSSSALPQHSNAPQLIQESPSMSVLNSKLEDISLASPSNPDTSLLSEMSSGETEKSTVTTTMTTTTTGDDATIIIKDMEDEEVEIPKEEIPVAPKAASFEQTPDPDPEPPAVELPTKLSNGSIKHEIAHEIIVEEQDVYQIVEAIRKNTNLSHDVACVALRVVISEMEALLPPSVLQYLEPIAAHLTVPLSVPDNLLGQTYDALRLRSVFSDLADCKNDSEQRTWMLYEDETEIKHFLQELVRILTDADPKICCYEMSCDQYQSIINLVLYYQMETRWEIKKLLLKAFEAMCHLDVTAVDILSSSVLPLELVQEMSSNSENNEKLKDLADILTIIFCTGRKMPINHSEHVQADFVLFVLNIIENPPESDQCEQLPDIMINFLLAYNLQFTSFAENTILDALQSLKTSKTFTEKLLLLINREEDPVNILKHTKPPVNSVLKMFVDLFSIPETTTLFYTNDNKVLIDILVRQLADLSAGDPLRKWYLELCRRILRNTNYSDHLHRSMDLMKIFTRIFCEETECSAGDQQIVREISNEFAHIFKA